MGSVVASVVKPVSGDAALHRRINNCLHIRSRKPNGNSHQNSERLQPFMSERKKKIVLQKGQLLQGS